MKQNIFDCVVVGAGASGLMAAISAGARTDKVLILEKNNSYGRKLLISGKGRCNITNICGIDDFLSQFSRSKEFLRSTFNIFFNEELIEFFEAKGLRLKVERGGRVFPESDLSESVLDALKKYIKQYNIKILLNSKADNCRVSDRGIIEVIASGGIIIRSKKLILATGGASYPGTGSTGDGFKIAKALGHKIIPLKPGLVPLETLEKWPKELSGLILESVRIKVLSDKKNIESDVGDMLFTHFGVSGPLVLELSGAVVDLLSEKKSVKISIDLKPGLNDQELDNRLQRDIKAKGSTIYKNLLKELLPRKFIDVFVGISEIDSNKPANQISKRERIKIRSLLKDFQLNIRKPRPLSEAIITRGGVSTREIDPKTMESMLVPGLYFCGEVIDIDAQTGGFNLQAAFSTGYLAGKSAAESLKS